MAAAVTRRLDEGLHAFIALRETHVLRFVRKPLLVPKHNNSRMPPTVNEKPW